MCVIIPFKKIVLIILAVVVLNHSNVFLAQCIQVKPNLYFGGLRWIHFCVYVIWRQIIKMSSDMVMKWLRADVHVIMSSFRERRQTLKSLLASRALQCV